MSLTPISPACFSIPGFCLHILSFQLIRALDFKKDLQPLAALDQEWAFEYEYTVQNQQLEYIASVSQHWAGVDLGTEAAGAGH